MAGAFEVKNLPAEEIYKKSAIDAIGNIFNAIPKENPSVGYGITFTNDGFAITASVYTAGLRNEEVKKRTLAEASGLVDFLVKRVKEQFKEQMKSTLSIDLIAENYDAEVISMNNRYKLTYKKMFVLK